MIYYFRRYQVEPSPAYPARSLERPVIPLFISGPRGALPYLGLLDTGSDDTKIPLAIAERLGIELDRGHPVPFRGVGGEVFGVYGTVTLELRQSPKSYRWTTVAAFLPDPPDATDEESAIITLGHTGFFRYFRAAFDYQRIRVDIRPNSLFSRVALPRR